uniref:Uncharacterized protein n=1 Tax=Pyrodinium bahamense TaxID=73915 RepID=A0A7S0A7Y4_9DINO
MASAAADNAAPGLGAELVAQPGPREQLPAVDASSGPGWELHLGPLTWRGGGGQGAQGVELRPQLKLGGQVGNFKVEGGFSDVRDGLRFDWGCKAFAEAEGSGRSLAELHESVRQRICSGTSEASSGAASAVHNVAQRLGLGHASCTERLGRLWPWQSQQEQPQQPQAQSQQLQQRQELQQPLALWAGAGEALETAGRILGSSGAEAGSRVGQIASSLGVNVADLDHVLSGRSEAPGNGELMTLRVRASTGFGVSAQMCLGWCNTQGYRMLGISSKADAGISMGGDIFAGWHHSGVGIKIVLGLGNFMLEYHFPRAVVPQRTGSDSGKGEATTERAQQFAGTASLTDAAPEALPPAQQEGAPAAAPAAATA